MKKRCLVFVLITFSSFIVRADETEEPIGVGEMPPLSVDGFRVAEPEPVGSFEQVVSGLSFEPQVDVMSRNLAEGQGDISIRGGIFESTGFILGAANLFDPQTGHYFSEIPVPSKMVSGVNVYTGADNALWGFNSTAGSIAYGWSPVESGMEISTAVGDNDFYKLNTYGGFFKDGWGADSDYAYSESDGTLKWGDYQFERYAARIQHRTEHSQTDLFVGYQSEFFSWPNLYVPQVKHDSWISYGGSGTGIETENLQTTLFLLNHKQRYGDGSWFEASAYQRRLKDDYELDRFSPGLFNPYEHETKVRSASIKGFHELSSSFGLNYSAILLADEIDSTSLVFGDFQSRSYYKLTLLPEYCWGNEGLWKLQAGVSYDDSNRDESSWSPIVRLEYQDGQQGHIYYIEAVQSTQLAGYTAISSNSLRGVFLGNQDLGREESWNFEVGGQWLLAEKFRLKSALFYRVDNDLTDWVMSDLVDEASRKAEPVDIDVWGMEIFLSKNWDLFEVLLGYTQLHKDESYNDTSFVASFYGLNYARHRLTAALVYRPLSSLELRMNNEIRIQEENPLRQSSDRAFISDLNISWFVPAIEGLDLYFSVANLFNEDFEEIPSVPASPRSYALGLTYRY